MKTKIIQIATLQSSIVHQLFALDNQGNIWVLDNASSNIHPDRTEYWRLLPLPTSIDNEKKADEQ